MWKKSLNCGKINIILIDSPWNVTERSLPVRGPATTWGWGAGMAPTFSRNKKKKGEKRKKRNSIKAVTNERLSPMSKCYFFSHCRACRFQKFLLHANPNHFILQVKINYLNRERSPELIAKSIINLESEKAKLTLSVFRIHAFL